MSGSLSEQQWDGWKQETGEIGLWGAAEPLPDHRFRPIRGFLQNMEGNEILRDFLVSLTYKYLFMVNHNFVFLRIQVKSLVILWKKVTTNVYPQNKSTYVLLYSTLSASVVTLLRHRTYKYNFQAFIIHICLS